MEFATLTLSVWKMSLMQYCITDYILCSEVQHVKFCNRKVLLLVVCRRNRRACGDGDTPSAAVPVLSTDWCWVFHGRQHSLKIPRRSSGEAAQVFLCSIRVPGLWHFEVQLQPAGEMCSWSIHVPQLLGTFIAEQRQCWKSGMDFAVSTTGVSPRPWTCWCIGTRTHLTAALIPCHPSRNSMRFIQG